MSNIHHIHAPADAAGAGFDQQRLARIDGWMERWVADGKLPFAHLAIHRHGVPAYEAATGVGDVATAAPYRHDAIVRIYSMTKPVTCLAALLLVEEGRLRLDDRLDAYLPEFADMMVLKAGATSLEDVEACREPITIHHLMTHMAGFSYSFNGDALSAVYTRDRLDFAPQSGGLAETVSRLATQPLLFEPGRRWHYSVATDVLGRVIEVISGRSLAAFIAERITEPLCMPDTGFDVAAEHLERLVSVYLASEDGGMTLYEDGAGSAYRRGRVETFSGGGGLVSTMADYCRFADMLRRGGELDGVRIAGPRTIAFMTANHLAGDIATFGPKTFAETSFVGVGFGLGVWSMLNPALAHMAGSPGDFGWGGMASTVFWVDPLEDMSVVFFTQLIPSSQYPLRKELRALVHQAIVD